MTVNGLVRGTVLLDGFVEGSWRFSRTNDSVALAVRIFGRATRRHHDQIIAEGLRLLTFSDPGQPNPEVRIKVS